MNYLRRPFFLGKLKLSSNIFCAPLAGGSDLPFRRMTSFYQPGLLFCEMVKMDALIRNDPKTLQMLQFEKEMHPIGGQLFGSKPKIAGPCARILEDLGFDSIDLNCGCPVDKVTKDGSGSGLLKNPQLIGEIISNMVAAVKVPVTVKIRTGWDAHSIIAPEVVKIAEAAGAVAICVHGRTRAQSYSGFANLDVIKECKLAAKNILVVGNGDIFDAAGAERMFSYTGCDAILLARGTLGQPWIIEDVYRHFSQLPAIIRTAKDLRDHFLLHFDHIIKTQPERKALLDLRRVGCWYLRKSKGVRSLREAINRSQSIEAVRDLIQQHPWDENEALHHTLSQTSCEAIC